MEVLGALIIGTVFLLIILLVLLIVKSFTPSKERVKVAEDIKKIKDQIKGNKIKK